MSEDDKQLGSEQVEPAAESAAPKSKSKNRRALIAQLLVALSALIIFASSRMAWINVQAFDDKSGESTNHIVGGTWAPELTAWALALLAGAAAALILRKLGRRILGVVVAIVGAVAAWPAIQLLSTDPDPSRAKDLLTSNAATQRASDPTMLSDWAQLTAVDASVLPAAIAIIGAACAIFGGILMAMQPGVAKDSAKYDNPEARKSKVEQDLAEDPTSSRVMWDAIDADIDPTERD